jgi:hypothetical protein
MVSTITREVAHETWRFFFDAFSGQHNGWRVSVKMLGPDVGEQFVGSSLSFEVITTDLDDDVPALTVMLGDDPNVHLS